MPKYIITRVLTTEATLEIETFSEAQARRLARNEDEKDWDFVSEETDYIVEELYDEDEDDMENDEEGLD